MSRSKPMASLATAALLLPALLLLLVWFVVPLAQLLRLSLSDPGGPLGAYRELLGSAVYRQVFVNTLILSFNVTVLCVALAYPTAYLLTRLTGWRRAIALYCVLVPLWVSVLVRSFSWMLLLGTSGPINTALVSLGLLEHPAALLYNTTGVLIGMVHVLLPYALLPIYTAMRAIEPRLLLASEGLGAGPATTFRRVYLPLSLPGVGAAAAFVFLLALGFFVTPALLGGIQNVTASMLIDNFVNERLVWPLAAAASFCLLLLILALLLAASRFLHLGHMLVAR
jgi:ABC-type spermidine/putrescine transport system permease subunit I